MAAKHNVSYTFLCHASDVSHFTARRDWPKHSNYQHATLSACRWWLRCCEQFMPLEKRKA